MYVKPLENSKPNLTLDIKISYHDDFHWTLIAYEQEFYTGSAENMASCLIDIERKIDTVMYDHNDPLRRKGPE